MTEFARRSRSWTRRIGAAALASAALRVHPASAQDCLGAPIAPARHAIGARIEPQGGSEGSETLIGGEYLHAGRHLAWGLHAGGIVDEFPPEDPALGVGGMIAYVGGPPWICPAASVTRWSPYFESFSQMPGDSDESILLFRFGVGLASVSGDSVRLAAWFHPHITVARTHLTFGDTDTTDSEREFFTDLGAAIAGGRFWGSGALRIQFADDPGEDIPFGAGILARVGVRF